MSVTTIIIGLFVGIVIITIIVLLIGLPISCKAGTSSKTGKTGWFGKACITCPANTYSYQKSLSCSNCPPDMCSEQGSFDLSNCNKNCPTPPSPSPVPPPGPSPPGPSPVPPPGPDPVPPPGPDPKCLNDLECISPKVCKNNICTDYQCNSSNCFTPSSCNNNTCVPPKPYENNTAQRDRGHGYTENLDRHDINCGTDGINEFHYNTTAFGDPNLIRYDVKCLNIPRSDGNSNTNHATGWEDDGRGNILYLNRLNVDCGENGFLTEFRFHKNDELNPAPCPPACCDKCRNQYKYQCGHTDNLICRTAETKWQDSGTSTGNVGRIDYLDRQDVKCDEDEVIQQFQLQGLNSWNEINYKYKCCKKAIQQNFIKNPKEFVGIK